ncbi:MAG: hypothetical protein P4L91_13165 [Burkholderiaceae bacterium]|nr:hypothetical protein [Burkholderiaceae bacterium]
MVATIIPPPALSAIDATLGVAATGDVTNSTVAANIAEAESQASIVELSAEARILSSTAAALKTEEQNARAFQENIAQSAAATVVNETKLTANAANAQRTALSSAETAQIDQALQSSLADMELSQALAATATPTTSAEASALATPAAVATPTAAPAISAPPAVAATAPTLAAAAVAAQELNPAVPNTDPAVAAAIAAYRLGDGLFTERDARAEQVAQEEELDIVPVPAIQGSKVDLHDSARDDALHGSAWNWVRVHPVQSKFNRR